MFRESNRRHRFVNRYTTSGNENKLQCQILHSTMGMYSLATELSTFKKTSAIKVRVIRSYLVPLRKGSKEIKSKEIVFHDSERTRPPKQIQDLVNRCMLFSISAKTEHLSKLDSAFPVFKINTDQQLLKQHCPEILGIPEEEVNTEMLSLEDDEILEGFLSDEADSPIATLPPLSGEAAEGSVKRSLIDEFSSTQGCRKVKQHRVKVEKID
nr:replication factor A protein 1-like [Ipomoea batatas]